MYLVYHKRSAPTGMVLGRALGIDSGYGFPEYEDDPRISYPLIRWGSRVAPQGSHERNSVINTILALQNASEKLTSLQIMREAGINVPDFDVDPRALRDRVGYPIMGRKHHHARGSDIILVLQERNLRTVRDFYTQYIPTKREYRIHVAFGEVIRVQGKFLDVRSDDQAHIRNHGSGYRFRAPRKRLHSDRLNAAVKAVAAHGLDFGAVDLIVSDDGKPYVLEVNTAPACSPITAGAYVAAFASKLNIPLDPNNLRVLHSLSNDEESVGEFDREEDLDGDA